MDTLTGLNSRADLLKILDAELRRSEHQGSLLAVLLINISHFRTINTVYGYQLADQVLREIASRILSVKRSRDNAGRLGSDEFLLVLPDLSSSHVAELAANKIITELEESIVIDDHPVRIRLTAGIAVTRGKKSCADALVQQADLAMQQARDSHRRYRMTDATLQEDVIRNNVLACDLEKAISHNELQLFYQPKVNLQTQKLSSTEALVRWNHPQHGDVRPDEFVKLAEENSLILQLTLWTLNTALRQSIETLRQWNNLRVAVNLSASILDDAIVELIMNAIRTWDLDPRQLILEVTENAVMKDPERCLDALYRLRTHGVSLSLDDFGTGYSSFSYLKRLPVQELKIDQSFVRKMTCNPDDTHIVQAMISLGRNFNIDVIAEGIETRETFEQLVDMGCHYGQGYYIARPMDHQSLLEWIATSGWTGNTVNSVAR